MTQLDSFETKLLAELRTVVAENAATPLPTAGPPRWRRPLIAVAATGLAAATINRLEGAERLEADLARLGIIAHVDYTPAGTLCRPGRYVESRGVPGPGALEVSTAAGRSQSTLTLPKDALRAGETFVIESAWADDDTWLVGLGIAAGEVAECVPELVPWASDARPADVPAGGEPVTSTSAEDAPGSAPRR